MLKHLTSAVKPLRTFLSFKDFNLLRSLAPSARPFFQFDDCLLFCLLFSLFTCKFLSRERKIPGEVVSVLTVVVLCE